MQRCLVAPRGSCRVSWSHALLNKATSSVWGSCTRGARPDLRSLGSRRPDVFSLGITRPIWTGTSVVAHGGYERQDPKSPDEVVNVVFVTKDGESIPVAGKVGDNILYLAHRHHIELEGACEASLACSTCHVVLDDDYFERLEEMTEISEDEEDMLDLAFDLQPTSRLGCQIILSKELEGMRLRVPSATRNFYVDGHVPEPH